MLTRVCYLYRDASNYKFWGYFFLDGVLRREEVAPFLIDKEWFIPEVIGLEPLRPPEWTEEDHDYHELHEFDQVEANEAAKTEKPFCTSSEFISRMKKAALRRDELVET